MDIKENYEPRLREIISSISGANKAAILEAQKHMDSLIKPLGSLGKLESMAIKLAGITGQVKNRVDKKCSIVMAADNGICAEGVSCSPQDITLMQAINMTKGICGMGVLSKHANADLKVVDIGIMQDYDCDKIYNRKIKYGTDNFAKGPAMTYDEAVRAIMVGIEMVKMAKDEGVNLIGTGEMGIGNTSSTSAVFMALTGKSADEAVGKGGGLTEEALAHKKEVLTEAIKLNKPDPNDPIDVIAKVGGLDIAGLVGCYIGAAYYRLPIVVDGVISALAAFTAIRIKKEVQDFLFVSHKSAEPVYNLLFEDIDLKPILDLEMRLGEGTGAVLAFDIISAAAAIMREMATFGDMNRDETYRVDIRE